MCVWLWLGVCVYKGDLLEVIRLLLNCYQVCEWDGDVGELETPSSHSAPFVSICPAFLLLRFICLSLTLFFLLPCFLSFSFYSLPIFIPLVFHSLHPTWCLERDHVPKSGLFKWRWSKLDKCAVWGRGWALILAPLWISPDSILMTCCDPLINWER